VAIKNPRLKKPNITTEYTPQMLDEMRKCVLDPVYFINNYVHIRHPKLGRIPFKLRPYQIKLIRAYQSNRWCISKIARQSGKTETTCAYLTWFAIFHEEKNILVAANKLAGAKEIVSRIQGIYEELPNWLKPGIDEKEFNKTTLAFENRTKIIAQATSQNTGRGLAISLLYMDELAFVPPHIQKEMWTSLQPVLSTGGSCIVSSTPNGDSDLFAEFWRKAESGKEWFPISVRWDEIPGRDEKFRRETIELIGERRWRQEYECEMLTSEHTLIDPDKLTAAENRIDGIQTYEIFGNSINQTFWKIPSRHHTYIVGVDPSQGTGNDYSVIQVFEFPSMEQVMEYRTNKESPTELYSYLKSLVRFLERNSARTYFSVENNALGQAITSLYEADVDPIEKGIFMSEEGKDTLGYNSNIKTKNLGLISFKEMFERGHLIINSKQLISELKNLVRKGNTFEAKTGGTDDTVFATLICIRIVEDMAQHDVAAYAKMYSFQHVKAENWSYENEEVRLKDGEEEDEGYMPFLMG
jgi:hypothetical protein